MKDYLFAGIFLDPPGGGEGVANWMIQELAERGSLSVLTWDPPDLKAIDKYYGTRLSNLPIEFISVAPTLRRILKFLKLPHRLISLRLLQRKVNSICSGYRHCFSAFNRLDLGPQPAVQYCHQPELFSQLRNPWPDKLWARAIWPAYLYLLKLIFQPNPKHKEQNITIANSFWTANALLKEGVPAIHRVIYPPPLSKQPKLQPKERKYGFVSLARLDSSKNWEGIIKIIEGARARGYDLCLTILCSRYNLHTLEKIEKLAKSRQSWIRMLVDQSREVIDQELSTHTFALHAMVNEHYGMAVAEMVLAGCITFVHDSGGQVEIVPQPQARYSDTEDAINKICAVIADEELKEKLRIEQSRNHHNLTKQKFQEEFAKLVTELEAGRIDPILIRDR